MGLTGEQRQCAPALRAAGFSHVPLTDPAKLIPGEEKKEENAQEQGGTSPVPGWMEEETQLRSGLPVRTSTEEGAAGWPSRRQQHGGLGSD